MSFIYICLGLIRYIHLNPVRAGLVENARHYSWSGHNAYLGQETGLPLKTGQLVESMG